ncbi:MAG: hypothetical protein AAFY88_05535 [Acidobacteriota bacterium]
MRDFLLTSDSTASPAPRRRPVSAAARLPRLPWLLLALGALWGGGSAWASPLVTWQQELIRADDAGPRLAVDAQGRVEAHIPVFLRGAGAYAFDLSPDELSTLRRDLARLDGFDAAALRQVHLTRLRSAAASGPVPIQAGAAPSVFYIDGVGEISWRGLDLDASWVGDWRLELLADLERRFQSWLEDPRRRPAPRGGEDGEVRP